MKVRHLAFAASCAAAGVVAFSAILPSSLPTVTAQSPAPMDAVHLQALYAEKCSACHNLPDAQEKGYSRIEWRRTVNRMLNKHGASNSISPIEAGQIIDYLATFAPPPGRGNRGPADPWATDASDVWTVAPSATRVFNFEASQPLAPLSPLTAGTPGPAAVWRAVPGTAADGTVVKAIPVSPSPSRFALLLDKTDQGRNLDVKIRFQIQGGTVSPAVGIAFGVTGPKSYDVLRYDALHDTLSLLKINEPTHTTLQQTSVANPSGPVPTAQTVSLKRSPGWHTLRLLVNDGQIRGWIDMEKRISVQDTSYNGGKVALWTQGDTVAVFDDWTVDLYDAPASPADNVQ